MARHSVTELIDRTKLARIADALIVAVAVSLPWSTSLTGALLAIWLLALFPTLGWAGLQRDLMTPAGGLPVLLVLFAVLGMAWADVSFVERWKGLDGFVKLLIVPLLIAQFRKSNSGEQVLIGFVIACVALLVASWVVTVWPTLPKGSPDPGVAVKNYVTQSAEFTICAAGLLYFAAGAVREGRWAIAISTAVLSLAFLSNIFFVATSRTTLVVLIVLVPLFGARQFGWKGALGAAVAGLVLGTALSASSPYLRQRVTHIYSEVENYESQNAATSAGERLMYWKRSLSFIQSAPIVGHGTGSIIEMFRAAAVGQSGARAEVPSNPHNQTFAVAIQLGLIGVGVLWAMWIAHFLLFRGAGLAAWVGAVIVAQNVVGSLFNSFLFDFTEGWLYVVGVGVTAGMVLRQADADGVSRTRTI